MWQLFLMLSQKRRLLAVLLARPQRKGYAALGKEEREQEEEQEAGAGHLRCSRDARDADVAVVKLWVHADSRRRGLARRLLDVMRCVTCHSLTCSPCLSCRC